jgi:HEAT repeat protein
MQGHIFLSYRSIEVDFALKLAADLKNAGVQVWMDRFELRPFDDWRRGIEEGLNGCAAMICVMSPDYAASEYCRRELATIDDLNMSVSDADKKRPIFPVFIRPVDEAVKPIEIRRLQHIFFYNEQPQWRDWHDESLYRQRFHNLLAMVHEFASLQVQAQPDRETQYLNSLIAELESRRGVLEYVALAAESDSPPEVRPKPQPDDEWGFAELVDTSESLVDTLSATPTSDVAIQRVPLRSIAEAVEKHARFVLVGEPGAGKTTTIRRLALDAARKRLKNPRTAPLPMILYLPQWGDEATPLDFVCAKWPFETDPVGLLQSSDVLLYLDGLNEMGSQGVERARLLEAWFASDQAPKRVIITCRAGDYQGELKLAALPTVLAQELDELQIRQFATNYLKEKAGGFLARLMPDHQREQTRALSRLARNPYMLGALTYLYENSPSGDLPRNPGALFQRLARALWKREEGRGTTEGISFEQAEAAFAKLAFAMIDDDRPIDVPLPYALTQLGSDSLLRIGLNASFVTVTGSNLRFYHQLMQEYFAAVHLAQVGVEKRVEPPTFNRYGSRRAGKWDQAIIALSGISQNVEAVLSQVAAATPWLALRCIESGLTLTETTRNTLLPQLQRALHHKNVSIRREAAEAIATFGGEQAIAPLLEALHDSNWAVRFAAANGLGRIGTAAVPGLLDALRNDDQYMRRDAARALGDIADSSALTGLLSALGDNDKGVRDTAVKSLARIGVSALPDFLKTLMNDDKKVRSAAVEVLRLLGDGRAVPPLIHALDDSDKEVRRDAASALGHFKDKSTVQPLISALHDKDKTVRSAAAESLGQLGDESAVAELVALLDDESSLWAGYRVCDIAAQALERFNTADARAALQSWREKQKS